MNIYRNDEYLDLEFRALLRQIKISIINVNSRFLLEYYTYWLEYLNNENTPSKRPRNQLLKELASQIENQDLRPPFTEKPYSKVNLKSFSTSKPLTVSIFIRLYP